MPNLKPGPQVASSCEWNFSTATCGASQGFCMDGDKPEGGQWNFDAENRKPAKRDLRNSTASAFPPDSITREVIEMVDCTFRRSHGSHRNLRFCGDPCRCPEAARAFSGPCTCRTSAIIRMPCSPGEPFLWHSILSPYINSGLLDPLELCHEVEERYRNGQGAAQRCGRLYPADHRLARICTGHLLAGRARLCNRRNALGATQTASRILLDR